MTTATHLLQRARQFRKELTATERLLWTALRGRQLGVRFYRQHVIGPFIADFCCLSHRLVVEVDGGVHDKLTARDYERDAYLMQRGWRVLRIRDDDVRIALRDVLSRIESELKAAPRPLSRDSTTVA